MSLLLITDKINAFLIKQKLKNVARAEFEERVRQTEREGFTARNMKEMLESITPKYGIWTLDDRKEANKVAKERLA